MIEKSFSKNFEDALKSAKIEDVDFLMQKGVSFMEGSDEDLVEKAERIFEKIVQLDEKNFIAHNNLGIISFNKGMALDAEEEYKTAIDLAMDYNDSAYRNGSALEKKGKLDEAKKLYESAIETSLRVADFHYNLGILLHNEKKYKESEHEYRQSIEEYVEYAEALTKTKILGSGKISDEKILNVNLGLADAHYNLALLLYEQKKYGNAEKEYRKTIDIVVDYAEELTKKKILTVDKKEMSDDMEERILQSDTRLLDAHYNLGLLFHEQENLDKAEKEYKKVIELNPRYEDAHYNLGVLFQQQRKYEKAKKEYMETLRINSSNSLARLNLEIIEKKGRTRI